MPQNSQHPFYRRHAPQWTKTADAYGGEDAVKAKQDKYLPRPTGMNDRMYQAYLLRADWYAGFSRTINGLVGLVQRREPQIVGVSEELKRQIDAQHDAVTQLVEERLLTGQCGVLLNIVGQNVLANQLTVQWQVYPGLSIINWQYDAIGTLTRVILSEIAEVRDASAPYITLEETCYRELALTQEGFVSFLWKKGNGDTFELAEDPQFPESVGLGKYLSCLALTASSPP